MVCDNCGLNFPAKRISIEQGDTVGQCLECRPLFQLKVNMNTSELTRQEYLTRRTVLDNLRKYIREPDKEPEVEINYFKSSDPLAKYLSS